MRSVRARVPVSQTGSGMALVLLAGFAAGLICPAPLRAAEALNIELWLPQEQIQDQILPGPHSEADDDADEIDALLDEARLLIAAMIYGYGFVYVPLDVGRAVAEIFELHPRGRIAVDDERLMIHSLRREEGRIYGRISYRLSADQCRRMVAWQSGRLPSVAGGSEVSFAAATRRQALREAARLALRQHLRGRIASKPRRIVGVLQLAAAPRMSRDPTGWRAALRMKVRVERVDPYLVY